MEEGIGFDKAHAVHINAKNNLMFFDNGVARKKSRSMIFHLDEKQKKATSVLNTPLPGDFFTERMGSSYLLCDTTLLNTCSKRNAVVLTNLQGRFLWALKTTFSPYRTEFIPADRVTPFIIEQSD